MNPMYSTCIGLILRGYHDFESGKMEFSGENVNYIHIPAGQVEEIISEMPTPVLHLPDAAEPTRPTAEEVAEVNREKARKRNEKVKNLFDGLKGKFMKMFEDVEDQEIN